jgi:OOP family OmpA-OmpF porin
MKSAKALGTVCLVGFAAVNSQPAVAADSGWADSGWYVGAGIGQSRAKIDDARITAGLLGAGLTTTSMTDDKHDTAYKIFGGYKFNRNFAVEGGYFNLGQFGFTSTTNPAGTLTGKIKLQGLNIDAVGIVPLTEKFSAFGRLGLQYAQAKDQFAATGAVTASDPNPSKSAANYKAGLGVQYDFTEHLGMRGEWENYRINDAVGNRGDVNVLSVGLVYLFGADKPAPQAEAPRVIEAAPVLVVVPIPPARTEQYCSILDLQFDINKDNIDREDQEKLSVVEIFMKKYPDTTAVIEGHTDEVGTEADNTRLSQRRAESVVNYLAGRGIARSRLRAVGYGETRPIADNRTEIGKRLNRRINAVIACATDLEGLTVAPARVTMAMEMEFDRNQADVKPQYREELRKVANFMKANPRVTAAVEGHTSNQQAGSAPEQAMQLSLNRAQNVVNYLATNFNIDRSRLSAQGYGATRRFAYNTSAEGQRENRRVNIIFEFPK